MVAALSGRRGVLAGVQQAMQRADRALLDAVPWLGRYCWETVIVLAR